MYTRFKIKMLLDAVINMINLKFIGGNFTTRKMQNKDGISDGIWLISEENIRSAKD